MIGLAPRDQVPEWPSPRQTTCTLAYTLVSRPASAARLSTRFTGGAATTVDHMLRCSLPSIYRKDCIQKTESGRLVKEEQKRATWQSLKGDASDDLPYPMPLREKEMDDAWFLALYDCEIVWRPEGGGWPDTVNKSCLISPFLRIIFWYFVLFFPTPTNRHYSFGCCGLTLPRHRLHCPWLLPTWEVASSRFPSPGPLGCLLVALWLLSTNPAPPTPIEADLPSHSPGFSTPLHTRLARCPRRLPTPSTIKTSACQVKTITLNILDFSSHIPHFTGMTIKATLPPGEVDLNKDPFEDSNRPPGYERLASKRAEFTEHWSEVSHLLRELEDDVDDLRVQEGWDGPTAAGAYDWATDRGMVFRALRVSRQPKTGFATSPLALLLTPVAKSLRRSEDPHVPACSPRHTR